MSMPYAEIAVSVRDMLAPAPVGDGITMTVVHTTPGTYDPQTGETSGTSVVSSDFSGIEIPIETTYIDGKDRDYSDTTHTATVISKFDAKALLAPREDNTAIEIGDVMNMPDGVYSVSSVQKLAPAGITVLWEIGLVR